MFMGLSTASKKATQGRIKKKYINKVSTEDSGSGCTLGCIPALGVSHAITVWASISLLKVLTENAIALLLSSLLEIACNEIASGQRYQHMNL